MAKQKMTTEDFDRRNISILGGKLGIKFNPDVVDRAIDKLYSHAHKARTQPMMFNEPDRTCNCGECVARRKMWL